MDKFSYYCEVDRDRYDLKKGVYWYSSDKRNTMAYLKLYQFSDRIWRQGPKGGVKITKSRNEFAKSQYITKDEELMKKFMWVKLQAQPFTKGA